MMPRDHWNTGSIEAMAARWKALEALNEATRKFLAHVVALVPREGDLYLDDIPEVRVMKAALVAIDAAADASDRDTGGA